MGYLDTKGLKKVLTKIKSEINDKINDKINNISIPETGQPLWSYNNIGHIGNAVILKPYYITSIDGAYANSVTLYFDYYDTYLPDLIKEYKFIGTGAALNKCDWPSIFDMPWTNNEIPIFEEYKQYEIYIAGGRVVSVSDVSAPIEEVTYTITTTEGFSFIKVNTDGTAVDYYVDGEFVKRYFVYEKNTLDGIFTFTYTVKGDLSTINNISTQGLQYIKVDCSKMKSNNFDKVTKGLKIDEIIYPQTCVGKIYSPTYDFESNEVNLDFLYKNSLYNVVFGFKTNNLILNKPLTIVGSTEIFRGSKLTNKQINKILSVSDYVIDQQYSFSGAEVLNKGLTLGTLYQRVRIDNITELRDTNLFGLFGNLEIISHVTPIYSMAFKEIILDCSGITGLQLHLPTLYDRHTAFLSNFTENIVIEANKYDFYSLYDLPQSVKDANPTCTFTVINDISEVPFQYAPATWDDVKNYDENGNVVG